MRRAITSRLSEKALSEGALQPHCKRRSWTLDIPKRLKYFVKVQHAGKKNLKPSMHNISA